MPSCRPSGVVNDLGRSGALHFAHAVAFYARLGPKTGREAPIFFDFATAKRAREEAIEPTEEEGPSPGPAGWITRRAQSRRMGPAVASRAAPFRRRARGRLGSSGCRHS